MFREMRRKKQQLTQQQAEEILMRGTSGVLSLCGDDGYPYGVPLSYVYRDEKLYFHSAKSGHKIDAIQNCDKASFCVIDKDQVVPAEFTTYFRSAIAFGRIRILSEPEEIRQSLRALADRYSSSEPEESVQKEMEGGLPRLLMLCLTVEHLTGKESIELVQSHSREKASE